VDKELTDIKSIFWNAIEKKTTEERVAYLDQICVSDPGLRCKIEELLRLHDNAGDFLESPVIDPDVTLNDLPGTEGPGTAIGQYKLLEKIGEGGMAVVYMAEQTEPIRRKVALKIIKLGMDTKSVIARFEAERQALAMMDHPNIAKVFDAGASETGRPYFVMELVQGVSITAYCDNSKLDTRRRLDLMVQVCHAVQHAHQKGIIHRDIKPSNVLVTMHDDKPVPKVIDFGIAKATNQRLTEKTVFTRYAHFIGTPAYMSPEQAQMSGLDVDTRSDIYSLGVLIYELLTGTTPFDADKLREAGYTEIQRIICETDPLKPSTKLGTLGQTLTSVAQYRQVNPDSLRKLLKGDLDWIVMKCLEKDRSRRYDTAHALAEDIERHLRNEPILAHSLSLVYRAQKFWQRRRSHINTAAIIMVLLSALVVTVVMYRRASNLRWAKGEALPEVVELVKEGNYVEAFSLAQKAREYIPQDETLTNLWPRISKDYSITTTPVGASIFCREYAAMDKPWQYLGRSTLENITLPQGTYRWKIEKKGFDTYECVADNSFNVRLQEDDFPGEMVWIDAWTVDIYTAAYAESTTVEAPAYLIDKYEVTNEQFKYFVDQGGYENREYWIENPFLREGHEITWEQAINEFVDKTGYLGPATWENGTYPAGQDNYPVSGVSWFEANAYARSIGKSLPTIHHWERAACLQDSSVIIPYSNYTIEGTAPIGSHTGIGHTGLYDMAGNVKEWCWNATDSSNSRRYILGGGWGEQTYMFTSRDFRSPWNRAAVNGFRCVLYPDSEETLKEKLFRPIELRHVRDYSKEVPCSDEEFQIIKRQFEYDRTPFNEVVESVDDSSSFWQKEKITFDAAYGGERMIAYLFVPKAVEPPYQAAVYWPGTGAIDTRKFESLPERDFTELIITSGRALLFPVYKGTFERGSGQLPDSRKEPYATRDWIIQDCKDLRRSMDYLETREDIDKNKIAYYGMSGGAAMGPMVLAVENRFKAAVLIVGGFPVQGVPDVEEAFSAIDPLNHAPRVKTPVLMVNGKEDFVFPYETAQRPMYELLGTPNKHKEHKLYPGGHGFLGLFSKQIRGDVLTWLDRYLGPVNTTKSIEK
jgi:serine/threonine protein kinase/formylglycine-generating enzyme required for sulfatase activity/dienelactone hydrolase